MTTAGATAGRRRPPAALVAAALAVVAVAALPLAYLIVRAAGADAGAWNRVLRASTLELVGRTTLMVVVVTAGAVVLGGSLAWLVERSDLPGRRVLGVAAALPLVIPSYVVALALISAFGPGGALGGGTWLFGLPGSAIALVLATYPYVFLLAVAGLRRMDPELEEAARGLGLGRGAVVRKVTLPVLRPSLGAGGTLVALYTLSDFGVVSLMRHDVLTRVVFQQYRSLFDRTPAAILGLVLVALTVLVLVAEARSRTAGDRATRGPSHAQRPVPLGRWRLPALAAVVSVLGAALLVPVGTLVYWAARGGRGDGVDPSELAGWAANTVLAGGLAAVAATAATLPIAILAVRYRSRWTATLRRAAFSANALPGIVIALALVFFSTRVATPLYQTLPLLVVAYLVRFLPQALAGTEDALARVDPRLEEASRGLGAGPWRTLREVTLPLVTPGLLAGATLVFLSTAKELPVTLLLRPIGFDTLATEVWSATGVSSYSEAAAPALVLVLISLPVVWLLQLRGRAPAAAAPPPAQ